MNKINGKKYPYLATHADEMHEYSPLTIKWESLFHGNKQLHQSYLIGLES